MEWMIIFKGFPWKWRMHCQGLVSYFHETVNREPVFSTIASRWWFQRPNLGKWSKFGTNNMFQMGWFNHQLHPGRLTWNIQITHLERKMIFQTPRELCSMLIFQGVDCKPRSENTPTKLPKTGGAKGLCARRHRCRGEGRQQPDSTMGSQPKRTVRFPENVFFWCDEWWV